MSECPECEKKLAANAKWCKCGWKAESVSKPHCDYCSSANVFGRSFAGGWICRRGFENPPTAERTFWDDIRETGIGEMCQRTDYVGALSRVMCDSNVASAERAEARKELFKELKF